MPEYNLSASPDLDDAHWLPYDIDLVGGRLQWLRCDEGLIFVSTCLDPRMPAQGRPQRLAPLGDVARLMPPPRGPSWVWHTSFCGSTLVAQALHLSPYSVALREPLVLRRLSDAHESGLDIRPWVAPLVALLARPWHPGGSVVVKPTHAALNIAEAAMACAPGSRGLVLTSSLEDFLVSTLKKSPDTMARIPQLAARALQAGRLASRLTETALRPPTILAAAAVQWCAQRDLISQLKAAVGERLRVLDWSHIRGDLPAVLEDANRFLELGLPTDKLRAHVLTCSGVHAKSPTRPYGVLAAEEEQRALRKAYPQELDGALRWAEAHLLPAMEYDALVR